MLERLALSIFFLMAAHASAQAAEPQAIARVWVHGVGLDPQALVEAVGARLGDKEVLRAGTRAGSATGLVALCHVTRSADGKTLELEVVLGDGRVYQRRIAAPPGASERGAARLITSTLTAIEDETAMPDRSDGVLVVPGEPAETGAVPISAEPVSAPISAEPATSLIPEPALIPAPIATPVVVSGAQPIVDEDRLDAAPLRASTRHRELGVALELGALFGLGAPAAGLGVQGGGGGLRLDLRFGNGVAVGAGFRGQARGREDVALGRFRGALVVGHVWRRGGFEMAALAGPTLETWQVTRRGAPVRYAVSSPDGASLLFGGLARLALGGRVRPPGRSLSLRLGAFVEVAGSARGSGRAARIARTDAQGAQVPLFVLGGVELALGLEVELWLALVRKPRPRRHAVEGGARFEP